MGTLIKGGRILDPSQGIDQRADLYVAAGCIQAMGKDLERPPEATVIDAQGCWVIPGLIDPHVHLREPGFSYKETIFTGSLSGVMGGYTSLCCMPNTSPAIDDPEVVSWVIEKSQIAPGRVHPVGAITLGQRGEALADFHAMAAAGICALSEDGRSVLNSRLMKEALMAAKALNLPILSHCEDEALAAGGSLHQGKVAAQLGVKGIPASAEDVITYRDIQLAKETGARLHLCHMSTQESVTLLKRAKEEGLSVTGEVTPHHLLLTEAAVAGLDPNTKMNPPLRTEEDRQALLQGLREGIIDIIATDHAPHHQREKEKGFEQAPFGIVGLETALALGITELVGPGILTPLELIRKMSTNPAKLLGIPGGTLKVGAPGDIAIIDPQEAYQINKHQFYSLGKNTPFHGRWVKGRVRYTLVGGIPVVIEGKPREELLKIYHQEKEGVLKHD